MTDRNTEELAALYVLGSLRDQELREFEEQLARDPLQQLLIFIGLFIEMTDQLEEPFPGCLYASYCYQSGAISAASSPTSAATRSGGRAHHRSPFSAGRARLEQ